MAATLDEVKAVITNAFPDANVDEVEEDNDRISGAFTSARFEPLDIEARNQLVTEQVLEPLGMDGTNVGILVPLAPNEDL